MKFCHVSLVIITSLLMSGCIDFIPSRDVDVGSTRRYPTLNEHSIRMKEHQYGIKAQKKSEEQLASPQERRFPHGQHIKPSGSSTTKVKDAFAYEPASNDVEIRNMTQDEFDYYYNRYKVDKTK